MDGGMSCRPPAAALLVLLAACSSGGGAVERHDEAVPVTVARAEQRDAPVTLRAIGTVEAYSTVNVRSRVDGHLAKIYFAEGQPVRRDDPLFQIDPRPFEMALRQAEAALARDRVQGEHDRLEAGRFERLMKDGVISKDEHDQARTRAEAGAATVAADEAAVERVRLDLQYCAIASPIDGRIGQILVHEGNLVKTNDTLLAVINQLRPIHVAFAVPQQDLPTIRRHMAEGPLTIDAAPSDGGAPAVAGELAFVNNAVDQGTGTVLLKGRFENEHEELWPGQFVGVTLRLATERGATVIPASAVQTGQQGSYVFVVKADGTVESRPVVTGPGFEHFVVVRDGVAPGEQVVTEGQLRLAPGTRVEVKGTVA
jgi:multidrug efflux system membrane fusion protein